jgi:hypothetical protein
MTVLGNSGSSPQLLLQILDGHGLTGDNVTEAYIGQRLTLDIMLEDTCKLVKIVSSLTCNFFQQYMTCLSIVVVQQMVQPIPRLAYLLLIPMGKNG